MFVPDDYIRRTSSTIPFGYELDNNYDGYLKPVQEELSTLKEVAESIFHNENGYLKPVQEELSTLKEVAESIFHNEISLGVGVDWLEAETGRSMSRPGLKKYVDKIYDRFGK